MKREGSLNSCKTPCELEGKLWVYGNTIQIQIQIQIILLHYNVLHSQTEFDPSYGNPLAIPSNWPFPLMRSNLH